MKPRLDINMFRLMAKEPAFKETPKSPTVPGYRQSEETISKVLHAIRATTSISNQRLIEKSGVSKSSVKLATVTLEERGLITKHTKKDGRATSNVFRAVRSRDFNPKRSKPQKTTINIVMRAIKKYKELSRQSLVKKVPLSPWTVDRTLEYLFENKKINKDFVKKAGPNNIYTYSIAEVS